MLWLVQSHPYIAFVVLALGFMGLLGLTLIFFHILLCSFRDWRHEREYRNAINRRVDEIDREINRRGGVM